MRHSTYSFQFTPDYGASPAENVRSYIEGLPGGIPKSFEGLEFQPSVRDGFLGDGGKLDIEKLYREAIMGENVFAEQRNLMEYAIILDATKEEMSELVHMMVGRHGPRSSQHPIARSRNTIQWKEQAMETFGIPTKSLYSGHC
jgi:hypothetical protein